MDDLDFQIAIVDNNTRKKNLLLEGIRETPREEPLEIALDVTSKIKPDITKNDIEIAHRLGRHCRQGDNNRPIMVTLQSKPYVRTELLKDKKELNKHAICCVGQ